MSKLKDKSRETSQTEMKRGKRRGEKDQNIKKFWGNCKMCNMCVIGTLEGEDKTK